MRLKLILTACTVFLHLALGNITAHGQDVSPTVRTNTPSGFPVPRFVSLKSDKTNCRRGPSLQHPKRLTFNRKGLPVRVIAETRDHWRKIEDSEGDRCWVHATLLSGAKTAMVINQASQVWAKPKTGSRVRATLSPGVIAKVKKCREDYCLVQAGPVGGWLNRDYLWGYRGDYQG